MEFKVVFGDVFTAGEEYMLAHCISSDCALGAGVAVYFERNYHLRERLLQIPSANRTHPACIKIGRVYNLITKEKFFYKPTNYTLRSSLTQMRDQMIKNGDKKLAMPKIGAGLDKLEWDTVSSTIQSIFSDTDIDILVYDYTGA